MLRTTTAFFFLGLLFSAQAIQTVTELDLDKYLGFWVQVYTDKFLTSLFEKNGVCDAATYTALDDGTVGVFNQMRLYTTDGELSVIEGSATIPDASQPGQLSVTLDGVPFAAPYWVVALGPETYGDDGLYEYAVVTDPFKLSLFVLARDADKYKEEFDDDVLDFLEENGFTHPWNSPVEILQDNCTYATSDDYEVVVVPTKVAARDTIDTVDELDVTKYLGRWYQIYAGELSYKITEQSGYCITADYGLNSANNVSVLNQERLGSATGDLSTISGYAYVPDATEPGKLVVQFPGLPAGEYWVVMLGPDDFGSDDLYEYAVVTNSVKTSLFVLARDVDSFLDSYDDEVADFLEENGFDKPWNSPVLTPQDGCTYTA